MIIQTAYKFRIYPTKNQEEKLYLTLNKCRFVYNWALERLNKQRKEKEEGKREYLNQNEIQKEFTQFKKQDSDLQKVYAKALFMEIYKLFSGLRSLARLKKNGKKVGRLKFRDRNRFNTFSYQQSGWKLRENGNKYGILHLSKIGDIKIRLHRKVEGIQKQVVISKRGLKWYASICCDREIEPVKRNKIKKVGIDLGIEHFIVDTDGHYVDYPFYLKRAEEILKRRQRELSKKKKGSKNRDKARLRLASAFEKVNNRRKDFADKLSRYYVNNYSEIYIEDLNKKWLIEHSWKNLTKAMVDVAWGRFVKCLEYKAKIAGVKVIKVNPKNTTQRCSQCGKIVPKTLNDRIHKCPFCGLEINRDYNSSFDILRVGQGLSEFKPVEIRPLTRLYSNFVKLCQGSRKNKKVSPTLKVDFRRSPRKNTLSMTDDKIMVEALSK